MSVFYVCLGLFVCVVCTLTFFVTGSVCVYPISVSVCIYTPSQPHTLILPDDRYAEEQCLALSSFKRCPPQSGVSQELRSQ